MIYLLILLTALIGVFGHDLHRNAPDRLWRILFWLFTGVVIFIVSIRQELGIDHEVHCNRLFEGPSVDELLSSPARFVSMRLQLIFNPLRALGEAGAVVASQSLFALLLTIPFSIFILRNTRYWFSVWTLFLLSAFTAWEFEVIYQGAAIGIFLLAWTDLKRRKFLPYSIKVLVATFFHFSALFMIFLPWLLKKDIARKYSGYLSCLYLILAMMIVCLLLPMAAPAFDYIADFFPSDSYTGYCFRKGAIYFSYTFSPVWTALNWKGIAGYLAAYTLFPLAIFYMMKRYHSDSYLVPVVALVAVLSSGWIAKEATQRFCFYLFPAFLIAIMECYPTVSNNVLSHLRIGRYHLRSIPMRRALWCIILLPFIYFHLNKYTAPIAFVEPRTPLFSIYYPYDSWIENTPDLSRDSIIVKYYRGINQAHPEQEFYKRQLNEKFH